MYKSINTVWLHATRVDDGANIDRCRARQEQRASMFLVRKYSSAIERKTSGASCRLLRATLLSRLPEAAERVEKGPAPFNVDSQNGRANQSHQSEFDIKINLAASGATMVSRDEHINLAASGAENSKL